LCVCVLRQCRAERTARPKFAGPPPNRGMTGTCTS
jgi:hypothetical protein